MADVKSSVVASSRSWLATIAEAKCSRDELLELFKSYSFVGQLEVGVGGFRHWQVFIRNAAPIKFSTLKGKIPSIHLEPVKSRPGEPRDAGARRAFAYVQKDDTAFRGADGKKITVQNGEIVFGDDPVLSERARLRESILEEGKSPDEVLLSESISLTSYRYCEALAAARFRAERQKFATECRQVEVSYIWGTTGVGKSYHIWEKYGGVDDVYITSDYKNVFDQYAGQSVLVLEEFNSQIDFEFLLRLLDGYPLRLPARYEDKLACFTEVVILSNLPLESQYKRVQAGRPAQWLALLRRISIYREMVARGVMLDRPLPSSC